MTDIGTLKHAQIAAIEWNRQIVARVKAGLDASSSCPYFYFPRFIVTLTYFPRLTPRIGAVVPRRENDVVKHSEMSIQEIGELQD